MSTVLWANSLINGEVASEEVDYYWLYKHQSKLDRQCEALGLALISDFCDTTDLAFNSMGEELPHGVDTTDDMMSRDGLWICASEASRILRTLSKHIIDKKIGFGLLGKDAEGVVAELNQSAAFAEAVKAAGDAAKFNFCVVT